MSRRYVYVNLKDQPIFGVAAHNPPVTGGTVIAEFWSAETDHAKLLAEAERVTPPFRIEYRPGTAWEPVDVFPAGQGGLDAALTWAGAQADLGAPVRVIVGETVIREWPAARSA
jgi:hypothetical protein